MPPKVKVSREAIVDAALDILRKSGEPGLNARTVAAALNCSTQPVFSNFSTMEQLRFAVLEKAYGLYQDYIQKEIHAGKYPEYKASGMAYIRFAREEKQLFRLLFMRDRSTEPHSNHSAEDPVMEQLVQNHTGLNSQHARLFHLEMWAFVHGIATMFVTGFFDPDWELVSQMLTDAYQGLRKQYEGK